MYLSCGDVAGTDSMLSFERRSVLFTFGKESEQGRRMVEENMFERICVNDHNLIL